MKTTLIDKDPFGRPAFRLFVWYDSAILAFRETFFAIYGAVAAWPERNFAFLAAGGANRFMQYPLAETIILFFLALVRRGIGTP